MSCGPPLIPSAFTIYPLQASNKMVTGFSTVYGDTEYKKIYPFTVRVALAQVTHRGGACPNSGGTHGQAGQGFEH